MEHCKQEKIWYKLRASKILIICSHTHCPQTEAHMIHVVVTIFEQQDLKLKGCSTNQWSIELTPWVSPSFVCDQRWRCDVNSHSSGPWLSLGAVLVAAADIGSHRESAGDRITELGTLSVKQQQVLRTGKNIWKNTGRQRKSGLDWFCHA